MESPSGLLQDSPPRSAGGRRSPPRLGVPQSPVVLAARSKIVALQRLQRAQQVAWAEHQLAEAAACHRAAEVSMASRIAQSRQARRADVAAHMARRKAAAQQQQQRLVETACPIRVRKGAGIHSPIVTHLPAGATLRVVETRRTEEGVRVRVARVGGDHDNGASNDAEPAAGLALDNNNGEVEPPSRPLGWVTLCKDRLGERMLREVSSPRSTIGESPSTVHIPHSHRRISDDDADERYLRRWPPTREEMEERSHPASPPAGVGTFPLIFFHSSSAILEQEGERSPGRSPGRRSRSRSHSPERDQRNAADVDGLIADDVNREAAPAAEGAIADVAVDSSASSPLPQRPSQPPPEQPPHVDTKQKESAPSPLGKKKVRRGSPVPSSPLPPRRPMPAVEPDGSDPGQTAAAAASKSSDENAARRKSMGGGKDVQPGKIKPSAEYEEAASFFLGRAKEEEGKLGGKKPLDELLGSRLQEMSLQYEEKHDFVADVVREFDANRDGLVSKMEFRVHVRKMFGKEGSVVKAEIGTKEVDALFDRLDADRSGELDVTELKAAFKQLREVAMRSDKMHASFQSRVDEFKRRAEEARGVAETTRLMEQAELDVETSKAVSVGAQLGAILKRKALKVGVIIQQWGGSDGQIDKSEFAKEVANLGLEATRPEVDSLFDSLDDDGGGSLDMAEVKHALRHLMETCENANEDAKRRQKKLAELLRNAKEAQDQWAANRRAYAEKDREDDERATAAAKQGAERAERDRAARAAAIAIKKAAADQEKAAFEEKVKLKRQKSKPLLALVS